MATEPLITALLVEDDIRLAKLTSEYLEKHGLLVTTVHDGNKGLDEGLKNRFDVILLDLMLPGHDGITVCRKIRERSDVPILMITARGEEADRVLGLELGADDYIPKPFSPRELLARIRSIIRRVRGHMGPKRESIKVGPLLMDPESRTAVFNGKTLDLTGYEFDLLLSLASRAGRVLSREQLMEMARGNAEEAFDRSVDVHISRLRQKLNDNPRSPAVIKTIRGVGYQFATEEPQPRDP